MLLKKDCSISPCEPSLSLSFFVYSMTEKSRILSTSPRGDRKKAKDEIFPLDN